MSRAGAVAQAVRAAMTTTTQFRGSDVSSRGAVVRMFGVVAGVAYTLDPIETARRDIVGLAPLSRRDLLDALMSLPVGLPVAIGDLSERECRLLSAAPRGVAEWETEHLIRRVVRPATARFAVVAADSWREGMVRAGRFAPFCARAMLLPVSPPDLDQARAQASFYGIGICTFTAGELRSLVDPEPHVCMRHSSAQWWFAEELYRQVTESGSAAG